MFSNCPYPDWLPELFMPPLIPVIVLPIPIPISRGAICISMIDFWFRYHEIILIICTPLRRIFTTSLMTIVRSRSCEFPLCLCTLSRDKPKCFEMALSLNRNNFSLFFLFLPLLFINPERKKSKHTQCLVHVIVSRKEKAFFDNLIADGGWGGAHRSSPALDLHPHSRCMGMRRGGGGGKRWWLDILHCTVSLAQSVVVLLHV